ncbi:MAG: hypothetical protein AB7K71_03820 [Polyangiaceae bacterium]
MTYFAKNSSRRASGPMGISPRILAWGLGVSCFVVSASAAASPQYPGIIQSELSMSCPPPCTICHETNNGGLNTVVTAFGTAMVDEGELEYDDDAALRAALATLDGSMHDSDGDGVSDIDALRADIDPNVGGNVCGPKYGCGATIAKRKSLPGEPWYQRLDPFGTGTASLVAAALLWLRRRQRG